MTSEARTQIYMREGGLLFLITRKYKKILRDPITVKKNTRVRN